MSTSEFVQFVFQETLSGKFGSIININLVKLTEQREQSEACFNYAESRRKKVKANLREFG